MTRTQIETVLRALNADDGVRNALAEKLLAARTPREQSALRDEVAAFGALSRYLKGYLQAGGGPG